MLYIGVDLGTSAVSFCSWMRAEGIKYSLKGVSNQLSKTGLVRAESM